MRIIIKPLMVIVFLISLVSTVPAVEIVSNHIKGPLPLDPLDKAWKRTEAAIVYMHPQNSIRPGISEATVGSVKISSLNNGEEIAFKIQWHDWTKDDQLNMSDKFSDAVAIQFPVKIKSFAPSYIMGEDEKMVHIIHWKAAWEKDIKEGYQDVEHAYPNYQVDFYPGVKTREEGKSYYPVSEFSEEAKVFLAGIQAGNSLSDFNRKRPVEELYAEGFRTLTTKPDITAKARGVWTGSGWTVVIARPMNTKIDGDSLLTRGSNFFAIAIWDGGSGNVGARKNHSGSWLTLKIE